MQCSKLFPVSAQSGDKMRLVLIFIATDYHQAIVCSGEMGKQGKSLYIEHGYTNSMMLI